MGSPTAKRGAGSSWTAAPGRASAALGGGGPGAGKGCPGSGPVAVPCGTAGGLDGRGAEGAAAAGPGKAPAAASGEAAAVGGSGPGSGRPAAASRGTSRPPRNTKRLGGSKRPPSPG
eukprot:13783036-Alexandrium_andersonii.AAC.1